MFTPRSDLIPQGNYRQTGSYRASGTVIFSSVATDPDGLIYLAVGQYKLAEGLPVVELDQKGNVLGGFRVTLPTFENLKTAQTPTGYMAVSKIAIAGNHLYGLDTGGRVAVYAVP